MHEKFILLQYNGAWDAIFPEKKCRQQFLWQLCVVASKPLKKRNKSFECSFFLKITVFAKFYRPENGNLSINRTSVSLDRWKPLSISEFEISYQLQSSETLWLED
ncbi:hypothetical protein NPIL_265231 [Nephila pilipes]|uniref:Uncharacterized protein n=1 Tax=Nephila pilipes TaxID=299642 RepID=A0A8X6T015_NEPPI|nr:hypothetical protein NPIL_265231 [Nephila pilipes]